MYPDYPRALQNFEAKWREQLDISIAANKWLIISIWEEMKKIFWLDLFIALEEWIY